MTVKFTCTCGKVFFFQDKLAGRSIRCPRCQAVHRLPKPYPAPVPERSGEDDLSPIDPEVIEHLSDSVIDQEAIPHLRQTVQTANHGQVARDPWLPFRLLAGLVQAVGMLAVFVGLMTVLAGVARFIRGGAEDAERAVVVVLVGLVLGVGMGLVMIAAGPMMLIYLRSRSPRLKRRRMKPGVKKQGKTGDGS